VCLTGTAIGFLSQRLFTIPDGCVDPRPDRERERDKNMAGLHAYQTACVCVGCMVASSH
jgi:hypothetical protein